MLFFFLICFNNYISYIFQTFNFISINHKMSINRIYISIYF